MNNWFVFFVQTGSEYFVRDYLNRTINSFESVSFIPQIMLIQKNSSLINKNLMPMFPGYVFTKTIVDARCFIKQTSEIMHRTKYIIGLLGKENPDTMSLYEEEKEFLLKLCDEKYVVGESVGIIEGNKVLVTSGPLTGRESIIKRIDRHKRRAEIELEFIGGLRRINVSLEIIHKK